MKKLIIIITIVFGITSCGGRQMKTEDVKSYLTKEEGIIAGINLGDNLTDVTNRFEKEFPGEFLYYDLDSQTQRTIQIEYTEGARFRIILNAEDDGKINHVYIDIEGTDTPDNTNYLEMLQLHLDLIDYFSSRYSNHTNEGDYDEYKEIQEGYPDYYLYISKNDLIEPEYFLNITISNN